MLNPSTLAPSAAMPRPGWLGRLLKPTFSGVGLDEEARHRLVDAYAQGVVVHVFRASRMTDPLFLLHALECLGLPAPVWLHDHYASAEEDSADALCRTVEAGHAAVLFLRRPRTFWAPSGTYPERYVEALLRAQRKIDRPILLLPETLQWTHHPVGLRPTLIDTIFGNREAPGRFREVVGFLWNHKVARFHVGVPVDLVRNLERERGTEDRVVARKIRWAIGHHLSREEQLRTGPMVRSMARTRQMVLKEPSLRQYIATQVKKGKRAADLEKKAQALLRTIAADMRYGWLRVLDALIDKIWSRIYDGVVVDEAGLATLRRAARRGPVVLMPSHKSHIDYIVLSQVFFKDGLMPPLVAAGENLNFWPMGFIFRRSGAFFIRRSFKDKLYALVFAAYVRRLLKEGHALEFFIEGGRSRTGKLLPPRTGMLSMCVDPVLEGSIQDLAFVPVSISYEKIIEAGAYAEELAGGEKRKEDARGLLASAKLLRSRYGRVYVDFAEPVSLRAFAEDRGFALPSDATSEAAVRKDLITQLGHRVVYGINEVTRATPTSVAALILLSRAGRTLSESELYHRADWVISFLQKLGARVSSTLTGATRHQALREALDRFVAEGTLRWQSTEGEASFEIGGGGRQALDYYKNNILHFLVPSAVVALAVLVAPVPRRADVSDTAQRISRLLKNEFSFRVDRGFAENFEHASAMLVAEGLLDATPNGSWRVPQEQRATLRHLAALLAPFWEAYRLGAQMLDEAKTSKVGVRKFVALTLSAARRHLADGRIQRAEAAVVPTIKHAVAVLKDQAIVEASGGLILVNEEARDRLVEELNGYLTAVDSPDADGR